MACLSCAIRARLLALAATLLLSNPGAGQEAPPAAPLLRSLFLLDLPFLHWGEPAEAREARRLAFGLGLGYGNTFSHTWHPKAIHQELGRLGKPFDRAEAETLHLRHPEDGIAFLDGEVTRLSLTAAYGLSPRLSLAVEVPLLSFTALLVDGAIEGFHGLFTTGDGQRPAFSRGRFQLVLQRPSGALLVDDGTPSPGLGDVTASASYRRALPDGTRLSVDVAVKLPTGDASAYRGSGSLDLGLLVSAGKRFGGGTWGVRLDGGIVAPGPFRGAGPLTLGVSPFLRGALVLDARLGGRTTLSTFAVVEESPFRRDDLDDAATPSVEVGLGLSRRLGAKGSLYLTLVENVPRFGDAPDVAVSLGLRLGR